MKAIKALALNGKGFNNKLQSGMFLGVKVKINAQYQMKTGLIRIRPIHTAN